MVPKPIATCSFKRGYSSVLGCSVSQQFVLVIAVATVVYGVLHWAPVVGDTVVRTGRVEYAVSRYLLHVDGLDGVAGEPGGIVEE
jgi:hypothetical protein